MLQAQTLLSEPLMAAYRLYLQPGESLHQTWWHKWDMTSLKAFYGQMPVSVKRPVDRMLITRRQIPLWQPQQLSARQVALIRMQPVLPLLLTALGFQLLGCARYLWLGPYRQKLMQMFSEAQCRQLAVLTLPAESIVSITPEDLLEHCLSVGWSGVQGTYKDDPLWRALQFTLPASMTPVPELPPVKDPLAMLLRLERFL